MSQLFIPARELFLTGQLSWLAGVTRCLLLGQSFAPNFRAEFLSEIPPAQRIAISSPMINMSAIDGYASSDPVAFPALVSVNEIRQMIFFRDTGAESTSQLIAHVSEDAIRGLPVIPQGEDYFVHPNVVEGGFFRL